MSASTTSITSAAVETTTTTRPVPFFVWSEGGLDRTARVLMIGRSWQPGCPVALDQLRLVTLSYWGFDASAHAGQLVVNADSVSAVVMAFRALNQDRFPIRRMRLVDYYDGDDEKSMAADNTTPWRRS